MSEHNIAELTATINAGAEAKRILDNIQQAKYRSEQEAKRIEEAVTRAKALKDFADELTKKGELFATLNESQEQIFSIDTAGEATVWGFEQESRDPYRITDIFSFMLTKENAQAAITGFESFISK